MTVTVTNVDRAALPDMLLPLAKSHCRIDGSYDDDYLTSVIGRAIARLEATNDATINPTTVTWSPAAAEFINGGATLPVRPAMSFTAVAGSPAVDTTANYSLVLKWDGIHGLPIQVLKGAAADGLIVTLTAGYADLENAPQLLDLVLRHTAHLYENREILTPGAPYVAPDLAMDATWWMPRI
jgi:uncharacterized phiE125 gp8 family phage protein